MPELHRITFKMHLFGFAQAQKKRPLAASLKLVQALYALPLAVATSSSPVRARPVLKAVGWAGQNTWTAKCILNHLHVVA